MRRSGRWKLASWQTSSLSALAYHARTGRYTYQWKTDKAWKNTCQRLVLTFRDESSAEVIFHFKR